MQFELFKDKFPIYTHSITTDKSMDELVAYFQDKIENHPIAVFITVFDHYAHTSAKAEAVIAENIEDVKNVVFCFGKEIPNAKVPAVRPRSIAITKTTEGYTVAFMEAPNEQLTEVMKSWVEAL